MNADLDTLATALYVTIDDEIVADPRLAPERPAVDIAPRTNDAELVTLAVMQALLGYTSEARWLRYARAELRSMFPYIPERPGYNKRLRRCASLMTRAIPLLGTACNTWWHDLWLVESTPVECGRVQGDPPRVPTPQAGPATATARPRAPRRAQGRRRHHTGPAAPPAPDRCHLAQRQDRPARAAVPRRLRPLSRPLGIFIQ